MEKRCTGCGEVKSIEQFSLARNGRAQQKPVRKSKCKTCQASAARAWFQANRERAKETRHAHNLMTVYGITPEQYGAMLAEQGGVCAICQQDEPNEHGRTGTRFRLSVDHCHTSGRVRGLLCQKCNRAIGLLGDNIDLLRKAIDYLERE